MLDGGENEEVGEVLAPQHQRSVRPCEGIKAPYSPAKNQSVKVGDVLGEITMLTL